MLLKECLFENIPNEKFNDIEDALLKVEFTDKVDFDYDNELPNQLIIIPKHVDDFGHGSDYLKNHIEWKKNIIKTIRENGYKITDDIEDNDPYMYLVVEKKTVTESTDEDMKYFEETLKEVLENSYFKQSTDGVYEYTLWADYNDQLSDEAISDILKSTSPKDELYEVLWNSYSDSEMEEYNLIENKFIEKISEDKKDNAEEWFDDNKYDYINITPDYDHFLSQEVKAVLIIDNGDSNADFSSIDYTLDYTESGIDSTTGVAWLTNQQGHTVDEVIKEYADYKEGKGFVNSMAYELLNVMSSMNAIAFIGRTTLETLLNYKAAQAIKVDKGAMCGLFDAWYGSGSVWGIELEKDVIVPQKNIFYFGPDTKHDGVYSTDDVFGWAGSAYKSDVFELIDTNKSIKKDLKESLGNEFSEEYNYDVIEILRAINRIKNKQSTQVDETVLDRLGLSGLSRKKLNDSIGEIYDYVNSWLYDSGDFTAEEISEIEKKAGNLLENLKEDLTKYSAGMKVKIKGDDSGKVYIITDVSKEDGFDLYNLVDANNKDGDIEDEVYDFNELELVDRNTTIDEGYCLMERDWKKSVPKDLAKKFYDGLDAEDLQLTADAIRAICDWLVKECSTDCGITEEEVGAITDEISVIDLTDGDGLFSEPDEEDPFADEETNADYFDQWVIDPLYDLLDENSIWMPTRGEVD